MPSIPATTIVIDALGGAVALEARDEDLARAIAQVWRDCVVTPEADAAPNDTLVVAHGTTTGAGAQIVGPDINTTLRLLGPAVDATVTHSRARELLLLHASAMADPITGAGVVILGSSSEGRLAAIHTLSKKFVHLAHNIVGVDEYGAVPPYRSPMPGPDGSPTTPSDLGLSNSGVLSRAAAIVVLDHNPGHVGDVGVETLDVLATLTAIAPHTVSLTQLPHPLQRLIDLCNRVGDGVRITYGDPEGLVTVVEEILARGPTDGAPFSPPSSASPVSEGLLSEDSDSSGPITRGGVTDVQFLENGAAVLVNTQVVVLSEIGAALLATVPEGSATTFEHLTWVMIEEFGEPPAPNDAAALVRDQVDQLVRQGILCDSSALADRPITVEAVRALHSALADPHTADNQWTLPAEVCSDVFIATVQRHRVLHSVVERLNSLDLPTSITEQLLAMDHQQQIQGERLAGDVVSLMAALESAGIRALVFKGVALAAQAYGSPYARGVGDIDVLVSPADLASAHCVLMGAGATVSVNYASPDSGWAWRHLLWSGHELSLRWHSSDVDLHWHLSPVRGAQPDFEALWARQATVELHGRPVTTLGAYDALAHSASHAAKDHWRWLRSLVDVHRLASEPATWADANRELRPDERLTIGLAVLTLGRPVAAPPVVDECAAEARVVWNEFIERQTGAADLTPPDRFPGAATVRAARSVLRADGTVLDLARLWSNVALPAHLTARETSRYAAVVVPRVLAKRTRQIATQLRQARQRGKS